MFWSARIEADRADPLGRLWTFYSAAAVLSARRSSLLRLTSPSSTRSPRFVHLPAVPCRRRIYAFGLECRFRCLRLCLLKISLVQFIGCRQLFSCRPDTDVRLQTYGRPVAPFVVEIFNRSLKTGHFPTSFKKAFITPILKKIGLDRSNANSYLVMRTRVLESFAMFYCVAPASQYLSTGSNFRFPVARHCPGA
jgi:hypothetical protein